MTYQHAKVLVGIVRLVTNWSGRDLLLQSKLRCYYLQHNQSLSRSYLAGQPAQTLLIMVLFRILVLPWWAMPLLL
jgi:hypothetical protein